MDIKAVAQAYYSRKEIQQALLNFAKEREIAFRFGDFFGKRPDVLETYSDVLDVVKKGVTSFHASEERWVNPLLLGSNMTDEQKNQNRSGWDLILDLDGVDFIYAKIVGKRILEFLDKLGIKNTSVKFSGNKGFHIGVPFEAFSPSIIGMGRTAELFPDAARKIAAFIFIQIKKDIVNDILLYDGSVELIAEKYQLPLDELYIDDKEVKNFNVMRVIEIDTILISSRHLFRMPYSLNEKSGLVSIPVKKEYFSHFEKMLAKPEKVNPENYKSFEFLAYDSKHGHDGDILLQKAYEDNYLDKMGESVISALKQKSKGEFILEITEQIPIKDFPKCIQYVLEHDFIDGKKRALFLLMTFLTSIKWDLKAIEDVLADWNKRQSSPLKNNYIQAQFSWFKNQQKTLSTPLFENENYYSQIGIPADILGHDKKAFGKEIKSPLHYMLFFLQQKKRKDELTKKLQKSEKKSKPVAGSDKNSNP
jgi:DNA primase catalytic subunit